MAKQHDIEFTLPPGVKVVELEIKEIGDVLIALGHYAHTVANLAKAQRSLANEEETAERATQVRDTAATNQAVSEEIERTKNKFRRAARVVIHYYI